MTIRLETTCEQCGTTVHSLAYGYSDHFSRNMWHLQCSACGRLTTEQPFDWGDFPASPLQSVITWIPVSERLPGNSPAIGNLYLCYDADIQLLDLCVWLPELGKWHDGENCIEPDEYTHWAAAPTPPASEEGEG